MTGKLRDTDRRVAALQGDTEAALCRSALYEALALGFDDPSPAMSARLGSRRGAVDLVVRCGRLDPTLPPLIEALAETDSSTAWLRQSHRQLFGHATEAAIARLRHQELATSPGFKGANRVAPAVGAPQRSAPVRDDCEFMAVLCRREAVALEEGGAAALAEIRQATRLRLRNHLGRVVPALAKRLQHADGGGFYAALGALADAFVGYECARAGVHQVSTPAVQPAPEQRATRSSRALQTH